MSTEKLTVELGFSYMAIYNGSEFAYRQVLSGIEWKFSQDLINAASITQQEHSLVSTWAN